MSLRELEPPAVAEALKHDPAAVYLDVRTAGEFDQGHPAGALNMPVMLAGMLGMKPNPEFTEVASRLLGKDAPIFVGCKAGQRSMTAAQMLQQAGFTNLTIVAGGFHGGMGPRGPVAGWSQSGLPTSTTPAPGTTWEELKARAKG